MNQLINPRDIRWGTIVREKNDNKCKYCGGIANGSGHVIPRKRIRTRHVFENGISFCCNHHFMFDNHVRFRLHIINILVGKEVYKKLKEIANGRKTVEECGFITID